MAIFEANCPEFFSPNERSDYLSFLNETTEGYEVGEIDGRVIAAFGWESDSNDGLRLNWIMVDPDSKGSGIGVAMMNRVIDQAKAMRSSQIGIATTHLAAPFFAKFGAVAVGRTEDGWGPGMHRVDMELKM